MGKLKRILVVLGGNDANFLSAREESCAEREGSEKNQS